MVLAEPAPDEPTAARPASVRARPAPTNAATTCFMASPTASTSSPSSRLCRSNPRLLPADAAHPLPRHQGARPGDLGARSRRRGSAGHRHSVAAERPADPQRPRRPREQTGAIDAYLLAERLVGGTSSSPGWRVDPARCPPDPRRCVRRHEDNESAERSTDARSPRGHDRPHPGNDSDRDRLAAPSSPPMAVLVPTHCSRSLAVLRDNGKDIDPLRRDRADVTAEGTFEIAACSVNARCR